MANNHKTRKMIPVAEPVLNGNELKYVVDVIQSGWVSSLGKYVKAFENRFSRFCGLDYGVSVCNGTAALHLALEILGIGPGDEVIVPSLTFVATANAVSYTGAKPIFADSDRAGWTIDPDSILRKVTKRTKVIIPVHLYGLPCQMDRIMEIAKRNRLYVVEDCSEAHGAEYRGSKVGSIGDMGVFSFYGNKIVTSGEGGMIVMNNRRWFERGCFLRDHGMSKKARYYHPEIGFNYRITNLQAAVGLAQTEKIRNIIKQKQNIGSMYSRLLKDLPGIILPEKASGAKTVYWLYSVLIGNICPFTRDQLMRKLLKYRIDSRQFFIPLHLLPMYRQGKRLPVAEDLYKRGISLPTSPSLSEKEIMYICEVIRKLIKRG